MKHTMETIHGATLRVLGAMPAFLDRAFIRFSPAELRLRPRGAPNDGFSFVEQIWHLAEHEREGYGERIRRILAEHEPALPDFDGPRIARERNYASLDAREGLKSFRIARDQNVAILGRATDDELARAAIQEEVGRITLADIPRMMNEHDESHRREIEELLAELEL